MSGESYCQCEEPPFLFNSGWVRFSTDSGGWIHFPSFAAANVIANMVYRNEINGAHAPDRSK